MAVMEERALSRQIERLSLIGGPKGVAGQAMEHAADRKTNNAQAKQMQQLDGLIERLEQKRDEDLTIIQKAEAVIDRIRERRDRVIIRLYYIEGESDYTIGREIELSAKWVQQLRNKRLNCISETKSGRARKKG